MVVRDRWTFAVVELPRNQKMLSVSAKDMRVEETRKETKEDSRQGEGEYQTK